MVVPEVLAVTYLAAGRTAVHRARPGRLLLAGTDWLAAGRDGLAGRRLPVGCADRPLTGTRVGGALPSGRTGPTMTLHTLICHMLKNCKHNM